MATKKFKTLLKEEEQYYKVYDITNVGEETAVLLDDEVVYLPEVEVKETKEVVTKELLNTEYLEINDKRSNSMTTRDNAQKVVEVEDSNIEIFDEQMNMYEQVLPEEMHLEETIQEAESQEE